MDMKNLPDATTESSALRSLDLPESRREWLRQQLPSIDLRGTRIYQASAVGRLAAALRADPSIVTRAIKAGSLPANLHTR